MNPGRDHEAEKSEYYPFPAGSSELHFMAQRGELDLFFLSGMQIDRHGNFNLHVIGDYTSPSVRMAGAYGSAMLYYMAHRVILFRPDHTSRTFVERVDFVTAPGVTPSVCIAREGRPLWSPRKPCLAGTTPRRNGSSNTFILALQWMTSRRIPASTCACYRRCGSHSLPPRRSSTRYAPPCSRNWPAFTPTSRGRRSVTPRHKPLEKTRIARGPTTVSLKPRRRSAAAPRPVLTRGH